MDRATKILVTGASGPIGSHTIKRLLAEKFHAIKALIHPENELNTLSEMEGQIKIIEGDLFDLVNLQKIIEETDIVIHTAELKSFVRSDQKKMTTVNRDATANLVNTCLHNRVEAFIHLSSGFAISQNVPGRKIGEEGSWAGRPDSSDYGWSKYQAELEVWRGAAEGLPVIILNPTQIIGSSFWEPGHPDLFRYVDRGCKYYPSGSTGRVDVRDVAQAIFQALKMRPYGERFIINAENISYQTLLTLIAHHLSGVAPWKPLDRWTLEWTLLKKSFVKQDLQTTMFTRAFLQMAQQVWTFDATKSIQQLGVKYRSVDQSIAEYCLRMKDERQQGHPIKHLPH